MVYRYSRKLRGSRNEHGDAGHDLLIGEGHNNPQDAEPPSCRALRGSLQEACIKVCQETFWDDIEPVRKDVQQDGEPCSDEKGDARLSLRVST